MTARGGTADHKGEEDRRYASATTGMKAREEIRGAWKALRPRASHNYFYSRFREMKNKT
jgi:hypothetical protein